jgi:DNA modification methylase
LALVKHLIKSISRAGDVILDPFADRGSVLVAAYQENRKSVGIESNEELYRQAKKNISNIKIERMR